MHVTIVSLQNERISNAVYIATEMLMHYAALMPLGPNPAVSAVSPATD
jgi:hypothetical protein